MVECHKCGREVESSDRFCTGCGTSLRGVTDTTQVVAVTGEAPTDDAEHTQPIPVVDDDGWDAEPEWAPTDAVPIVEPPSSHGPAGLATDQPPATDELPATEPITEVWMESVPADDELPPTPYDSPAATGEVTSVVSTPPTATSQMPAQAAPSTAQMPAVVVAPPPPGHEFRFGLILVIGIAAGLVSLVAMFASVVTIDSDRRIVPGDNPPATFRTGTWILDDLADNLSIAGLIAIVVMVMGGVASSFGWRWGSGLAGGGGFAIAGLAALSIGLAQMPVDTAHEFARIPNADPFVLTITRDLGFWLLIVAGALGVVLFFASVNDSITDHRPGLNPWVAALGALSIVVAAAGPLIPVNQAIVSDNWYIVEGVGEPPALLLVGRLVQLGLLLIGGVVGFLSVRRWGIGAAIGVSLPAVWLTISVLFELTTNPVGPGFRNPGETGMDVHGVTIIGASAIVAFVLLGAVAAYDQSGRERL